jgi:hypothetical protein
MHHTAWHNRRRSTQEIPTTTTIQSTVSVQRKATAAPNKQFIFQTSEEELLQNDINTTKAWVHIATLQIKNHKANINAKRKQENAKMSRTQQGIQYPAPKQSNFLTHYTNHLSTTLTRFVPEYTVQSPCPHKMTCILHD